MALLLVRRLMTAWRDRRQAKLNRSVESAVGLHSRTDRVNESMIDIERSQGGFNGKHVR